MATLRELENALINAHNAGDTRAATVLTSEIDRLLGGSVIAPTAEPAPVDRTLMGQAGEVFRGIPRGAIGLLETAGIGASSLLSDEDEAFLRDIISGAAERASAPFQPKPGYEDSLAGTVGEALGSTVPFVLTGGIPGVAARVAAGAALGGASGAGTARTRAEQAGATEEERAKATALGVLPGVAEMVAPARIVGRLRKPAEKVATSLQKSVGTELATNITSRLKRVAASAGEEGLQEAASEIAQNMIAQGIYDPEQGVFANTGESFGLGAGVGGLIAALVELGIRDRSAGGAQPRPPAAEEPSTSLTEQQLQTGDLFPEELEAATADPEMVAAAMARLQAREENDLALREEAAEAAELQGQEQPDLFTPLTGEDLDEAGVPKAAPIRKRVANNENPAQVRTELEKFAANPAVRPEVAASVKALADTIPVETATTPEVSEETAPAAVEEVAPAPAAPVETAPAAVEEFGPTPAVSEETAPAAVEEVATTPVAPVETTPVAVEEAATTPEAPVETTPVAVEEAATTPVAPVETAPAPAAELTPTTYPDQDIRSAAEELQLDDMPAKGKATQWLDDLKTSDPETYSTVVAQIEGGPLNAVQPKREEAASIPANQRIMQLVEQGTTPAQTLRAIAQDKDTPKSLRDMASQMLRVAPNINVPIILKRYDDPTVVGEYVHPQQGDEAIYLDPRAESVAQTFVHEFIHPMTVTAIARGTPEGKRVVKLFEQYKAKFPESDAYGFTNAYEFVAEAVTNEKFQRNLKRQGWWGKLVDAVRRLIGLPASKSGTVEELIDLTKRMGVKEDAARVEMANDAIDTINTVAGNVKFMRALGTGIDDIAVSPTSTKAKRFFYDLWAKAKRTKDRALLWSLHMNSIDDLVKNDKALSSGFKQAMSKFSRAMHAGEGAREVFVQSAAVTVDRQKAFMQNATPEQIEAFTNLVNEGNAVRVDLRYPESRYANDPEKLDFYRRMKRKNGLWEKMGTAGQQLYRMRRKVYENQFKQILEAVKEGVNSTSSDKKIATAVTNKFMQELASQGIDGYEPNTRPDGDYKLSYFEKGTDALGYEIFSSKWDRDARAAELAADPNIVKGSISKADRLDRQIEQMLGGAPSNSFVGNLLSIMKTGGVNDATQRAVLEAAAALSPSRALAKRLMGRKDAPGYSKDPFDRFSKSVVGTGRQLENLKHGAQMRKALQDLQEQFKKMDSPEDYTPLMVEMADRVSFATNPTLPNWSNMVKTMTFAWTLGANVSSPIVDLSSMVLITYPHLSAKYGRRNALKAMTNAAKTIMGSGTSANIETLLTKDLSDAELSTPEMQKMLADMGIQGRDFEKTKAMPSILNNDYTDPNIDPETLELKELSEEVLAMGHSQRFSTLKESVEVGERGGLSSASAYMGVLLHATERFKRELTVVAQYQAELAKLRKEGKPITAEVRQRVAKEAVQDSLMLNGGASSLTKPGFTQSPEWSVVGMYKQYAMLMYYLQGRLLSNMLRAIDPNSPGAAATKKAALHQWLMMSATSAAFAGVRGMPLMGALFGIYNILFAGDDEDDAETVMRKIIGTGATEGLLASALNMNIGPRIEQTNLLLRDTNFPSGASVWDKAIMMFGGPTFGTIDRTLRGVQLFQDGHMERAVENFMPVALANVLKSARFAQEGALTLRGDPVLEEVGPMALGAQLLGFAPADYARRMDFVTRQKRFEDKVMEKRNKLYERAYLAYRTNDTAGYLTVMEDIVEFNKKYPNKQIRSRDLQQSRKTRDTNTSKMVMGRLPRAGFEDRWQQEREDWGF